MRKSQTSPVVLQLSIFFLIDGLESHRRLKAGQLYTRLDKAKVHHQQQHPRMTNI
jgi:hypothetical protein